MMDEFDFYAFLMVDGCDFYAYLMKDEWDFPNDGWVGLS